MAPYGNSRPYWTCSNGNDRMVWAINRNRQKEEAARTRKSRAKKNVEGEESE